jgi:hypothetical protein
MVDAEISAARFSAQRHKNGSRRHCQKVMLK